MNWNSILEAAIVGKALRALTDEGRQVVVQDTDNGLLWFYVHSETTDPADLGKPADSWVKLVPGNGADVISDYTTDLESILKPVNDFAASFQN